ncbi:reductase [Sphaerisporangium krabiense]|uniref:Nucleoside-diphosphate-sugar epimerase n=1 Tax=Sphaerisporangium krabiense TaxID=763782 RepID=A0A7W9DU26_9ACTN|nr:NAD-dependent epimerase/dehydratase family protein [Sphaerisporangium krabiense]MBB5631238.1 nucleoside-diphosphate-sugar epimerase [Sphaerisporangium krabiense]GII61149.1 reductase [Sphaerisporangium krabiense]
MNILVLGGTRFVGRAVVERALARGDEVTMLNRGVTGTAPAGVETITADRTDPAALRGALGRREWDAVLDTWSGAPRVVRDACGLLAGRAGHYGYVSSRSVYRWPMPIGAGESAPVVDADPGDEGDQDYAAAKRGGELAVLAAFGDRALLARAGLVLGPYEDIGRLPWWLRRLERGGRVLAPGRPGRPLQYVDARDLAAWMLDGAARGLGGAFNVVGPAGIATMGGLLEAARQVTGAGAELVWTPAEVIEQAGIAPWVELPIWLPEDAEYGGMHDGDVSAALAAGLACRPVEDTVTDTWDWLRSEGDPPARPDRPRHGLSPDKEEKALAMLA